MIKEPNLTRFKVWSNKLAENSCWGKEAITVNHAIIKLQPDFIVARTRLAKCFMECGLYFRAKLLYMKVLQLDPDNRIAANGLERANVRMMEKSFLLSSAERANRKIPPREERKLVAEIETSCDYDELYTAGCQFQTGGHTKLAIAALSRAHEISGNEVVKISLASAYHQNGSFAEAESLYREALAPGQNEVALVGLVNLYRDQGKLDEAMDLCREAFRQSGNTNTFRKHLYNCLGRCYFDKNDILAAERCFVKALEIPGNFRTELNKLDEIRGIHKSQGDEIGERRLERVISGAIRAMGRSHKTR